MMIKNCPKEAYDYEFIVVDNVNDEMIYHGHTASGYEAEQMAKELSHSLIVHNVRIQGYRKPQEQKYYSFSGTWSWGCYANSKEEAIAKFNDEAYIEELDISDYEEVTEEDV